MEVSSRNPDVNIILGNWFLILFHFYKKQETAQKLLIGN